MSYREEKDTMGTVRIPANAYYGAQTQRAVDNFPISNQTFPPVFIRSLALIKECAAAVNADLGLLDDRLAQVVIQAAREVGQGKLGEQFVVDVFQTGSGTSTNMNMNEVLATRANEILTQKKTSRSPVHPNDHVNLGQSSNDVIPTALHISALTAIRKTLTPALENLHHILIEKATEFSDVHKLGRTHLQDAVPLTLGQEFSGYARQVALGLQRINDTEKQLIELALGGTAVGSGLNAHPDFAGRVIAMISERTGFAFVEAENHFEAQAARDAAVATSGQLKTLAISLIKIANDIRWLASGPRCGLGEIKIPSLQPGSSIMPGKVNPVIPEMLLQVTAQVVGNDTAITVGGQSGNFELNVMIPLITHNLLQSIQLLGSGVDVFAEKCIRGVTANRDRCAANIERSLAMVTGLVPHIGYEKSAAIAKIAYETGQTVREVALEQQIVSEELLNRILEPVDPGGKNDKKVSD
jgi:fumarate hydratase class II